MGRSHLSDRSDKAILPSKTGDFRNTKSILNNQCGPISSSFSPRVGHFSV